MLKASALLAVMLASLTGLTGCSQNPVTGEQDFVIISESQEIAMGRKAHAEIVDEHGLYEDSNLNHYVQSLGETLAGQSHRNELIYRFYVLDSDTVNAFALPGGYIYITRGLMAYLNSEEELAAVLGHEIGHVTARHSVRQQSMATATSILAQVAAAATGIRGASDLARIGTAALVRGYGRQHELEADRLGAEYLARTNRDPEAMLDVIKVLKDQSDFRKQLADEEGEEYQGYHGVFSTHPKNDQRLQEVIRAADKLKTRDYQRAPKEKYLRKIAGMTFGDDHKQGIRRGNAFFHNDLDFSVRFPEGWKLENTPSRVLAKPKDGKAVMSLRTQDLNKRIGPYQFIRDRLEYDDLRNGKDLGHPDLQGYTAIVERDTSFGTRDIRVSVIYFDNKAWIFHGMAKDKGKLHEFDRDFLNTARSFRRLNSQERKLSDPLELAVYQVKPGDTLAKLAKRSPIPVDAEAQLRLLNGLYPEGEIQAGEWIKVVK